MRKDGFGPKLEALTLESVADGSAESMFQAELESVAELFTEPALWADAAGKITAKVSIGIALIFDTETQTIQAEVTSGIKRPARKAIRRPVFRGADGWSAVIEARQLSLGEESGDEEGVYDGDE